MECGPNFPRRDVLWISAEDDDADTVRPRIQSLGGDPSRVHSLQGVGRGKDGKSYFLDLSLDITALNKWLQAHPLTALVVLDPIMAFMGKTDCHKNSDVRSALTPLAKLAAKRGVAVVGINHLNKGIENNAAYRSMGSIAFAAASRSSWLVTKDPKDDKRRLFTKVGNRLAKRDVGGLAFHFIEDAIEWEDAPVNLSADQALGNGDSSSLNEAEEWLTELLSNGPVSAEDVWGKAKADGLCERTINAAKRKMKIRSKKQSDKKWYWQPPRK
jgi:hypothetical protein